MLLDQIFVGLTVGAIYSLVALGISLIYAGLDIVHFAHGELYMFGAFFGLIAWKQFGIPYPFAFMIAMALTGIVGIFIERVFYRPLTAKGGGGISVEGLGIIICGFGMAIFLQNLGYLFWNPQPKSFHVNFGKPIAIGRFVFQAIYFWIICISLGLMVVLHFFLKKTKLGKAIRAVALDKNTSYLMGINVGVIISLTFGIAAALAAAAGVLIGPINFVQIYMGYLVLIKGFCAAVVGGFGSFPGAIVGGLILGVAENIGAGFISSAYKDVISFFILIFVLMIKPTGLFGLVTKAKA